MTLRINTDNFNYQVLESEIPVMVEFYSDTCIPCKQLSPVLGDIEEEYENQIKVVKVNVNFDEKLIETYNIMGSPTILFFVNGEEKNRLRGIANKNEITNIIDTLI